MKAILLSIKPEWLAKILNREKTIEIRKLFPKEYVGWVYIYCTKKEYPEITLYSQENEFGGYMEHTGNGKVVAKFWCDRVETIKVDEGDRLKRLWSQTMIEDTLLKCSCLTQAQMYDYLKDKKGFAIHISNLEIFDQPKELSEFLIKDNSRKPEKFVAGNSKWEEYYVKKLTKAPQNLCYIENID